MGDFGKKTGQICESLRLGDELPVFSNICELENGFTLTKINVWSKSGGKPAAENPEKEIEL